MGRIERRGDREDPAARLLHRLLRCILPGAPTWGISKSRSSSPPPGFYLDSFRTRPVSKETLFPHRGARGGVLRRASSDTSARGSFREVNIVHGADEFLSRGVRRVNRRLDVGVTAFFEGILKCQRRAFRHIHRSFFIDRCRTDLARGAWSNAYISQRKEDFSSQSLPLPPPPLLLAFLSICHWPFVRAMFSLNVALRISRRESTFVIDFRPFSRSPSPPPPYVTYKQVGITTCNVVVIIIIVIITATLLLAALETIIGDIIENVINN